jgi:hypothetical protein
LFAIEHASRRVHLLGVTSHRTRGQRLRHPGRPGLGWGAGRGRSPGEVPHPGPGHEVHWPVPTRSSGRKVHVPLQRAAPSSGHRPHRGIGLGVPAGGAAPKGRAGLAVHRYDVLGGLIHEYRPVAA